jgi:nitronate monooxygenase
MVNSGRGEVDGNSIEGIGMTEGARVHPWKASRAAKALGIRHPIIQGPFGGLSSTSLTAEVSNAGALGSYGAATLSPAQIKDTVQEIRERTAQPFSMNLWVSTFDEAATRTTEQELEPSAKRMQAYFSELGLQPQPLPEFQAQRFDDQVAALLEARPPVASFILGIPPADVLQECRRLGIVTIGTATTREEAKAIADAGMDLVVASGFEAGGHRGSFLGKPDASLIGSFALIPQVADEVSIPVIAAGGIADARGVAAALMLGADAVQIGTAFLVCEGSGISPFLCEILFTEAARHTALTRHFSGRLARVVRNRFIEDMELSLEPPLPFPLQRILLRPYLQEAIKQGRADLIAVWAGQAAGLIRHRTVSGLMASLIEETQRIFEQFALGDTKVSADTYV